MLVSDITINRFSTLNDDQIFINQLISKDKTERNIDDKTYYYLLSDIKVDNFLTETELLHNNMMNPLRFNLSINNSDISETAKNLFFNTKKLEGEFVEVLKFTSNRIGKNSTNLKRL